ncbi:tRNA lysidine(34) synthetase TilS [Salinispora tropica]|uniref:tRNA(Ile)-lysidine synthase n=1 Tax=Salinispora tropica (strain ATCC BAA-916 / DSM 44818 / JCM 13857 / NBRC 105044 / CNB-440) TaxID=369723 RepID=TILS_SALTO|nr:tRNA lysidine(34) synthetase TilS [Salinispora tropica]A4XCT1.1 RecName: Full=tRNA(Ile)-lysidine synthase; AltName: Full=tRNA(Ile)-2-lysyl-cytidine synthase; AltName: Full=tRNA(Ile)-lysidine synthetase [Salinispora tropica CNB-440]ABP56738.1 tRNA(Ile)-lysidine synthetase [Salinispora tropica CNB-440]
MAALAPPVAAIRRAIRHALIELPDPGPVLVACSGGADSLALAAATAFVAPRLGRSAGLVTVDHGLQEGSAQRAAAVADWARATGLAPVEVVRVDVSGRPGGPEAAARQARYRALTEVAGGLGAAALLTGHTRDDQAETVLLALARGAGPRGLAGMPARRWLGAALLLRPLLEVSREQTRAACTALGLDPWVDPHNADPAYARARVRAEVLPALVRALGPAVVDNLARTARLVAVDTAALDEQASTALDGVRHPDGGLSVGGLAALVPAVRGRVLHAWARELGARPAALSHRHVGALEALVTGWRGQGAAHLPGGLRVLRRAGRLTAIDPGAQV